MTESRFETHSLKASGMTLLINFQRPRVEWRRAVHRF